MARSTRWILTRTCDFQPGGILQLGQILAQPKDPSHALQPAGPLPLHEDLIVEHTSCQDLDIHVGNELSAHFDAWASFFIVSTETSASSTRSKNVSWHFDRLDNMTVTPSLQYVKESMDHGDVRASLKKWSFSARVYMVTGVRIASGARMSRSNEAAVGLSTSATVSLNAGFDPAGGGAGVGSRYENAESIGKTSSFVFAYRLNEIRYRGKITHKPFGGGDLASASGPGKESKTEIFVEDFEVLGVSEDSWKGKPTDCERVAVPSYGDLECYSAIREL